MNIKNSFEIDCPIARAWALLTDIPAVAPCMPGVEITEVRSDGVILLVGRVKLGPVQLEMQGEAQLLDADSSTHTAKLAGKARDRKGRGSAVSTIVFSLHERDVDRTLVEVDSEVDLAGSIAQYGRGSGLVQIAASQIVAQFAANLQALIARDQAAPPLAPARPISGFSLVARSMWLRILQLFTRAGANDRG
ncbi:SRPBCC family protein [Variovorax paradoxus]|uniref:SRPBCC family protein n=1 Tax=Variovorax paradoxus TaxID=34073 RepID=UPI0019317D35|nr:SRPBCC family protein [Variovorax paradoxus]